MTSAATAHDVTGVPRKEEARLASSFAAAVCEDTRWPRQRTCQSKQKDPVVHLRGAQRGGAWPLKTAICDFGTNTVVCKWSITNTRRTSHAKQSNGALWQKAAKRSAGDSPSYTPVFARVGEVDCRFLVQLLFTPHTQIKLKTTSVQEDSVWRLPGWVCGVVCRNELIPNDRSVRTHELRLL
jgi:hypothetical protein